MIASIAGGGIAFIFSVILVIIYIRQIIRRKKDEGKIFIL